MTSSERPSSEPLLKEKRRPQPYGGEENSGNALEPSNALNYRAWGIPAVLSRGIPGKALRAFPGSLRNIFTEFLRKVPAVLGVWPTEWLKLRLALRFKSWSYIGIMVLLYMSVSALNLFGFHLKKDSGLP